MSEADAPSPLLRRIAQHASASASRLAVSDGRLALSYDELDRHSNQIAHAVVSRIGTTPTRVALLFSRETMAIAAILGVLKSGHAYVALDTQWPVARMREILRNSGAAAVLCAGSVQATTEKLSDVALILTCEESSSYSNAPVEVARLGSHLTYILYTSGTSGAPKGVYQCDTNVAHHTGTYARSLSMGQEDRLTLLPSYAFDAAVMDIFAALQSGASLHLYDTRERGVANLLPWARRNELTIWHSTPSLLRVAASAYRDRKLSELRHVVLGGEAAQFSDVRLVAQRIGEHCVVVNGYGPTESTVAAQLFIQARDGAEEGPLPIGFPVAETVLTLRDGEIQIQSPFLALGYWQDEALTSQRFSTIDGHLRSYRTGDLAKRLPDSALVFAGRADDQVKVRGFRVEPGEVEATLRALKGVRAAVVMARSESGLTELIAFVVTEPKCALTSQAVMAQLRDVLPDYMLPSSVSLLDAIPLTPNGKLDRRALEAQARASRAVPVEPPANTLERSLASLWTQLLRTPSLVGVTEELISTGGNSLLLMQLAGRIHQDFGHELPLRFFFESPTIRKIARALERVASGHPSPGAPDVAASGAIPLTFGQQYLWEYYLVDPVGASRNNLNVGLRIRGPLDVDRLEQALRHVIARHEGLRTVLARVDDRPVQVVGRVPKEVLVHTRRPDLLAAPERLQQHCLQEAGRPFDLFAGPLIRAELYENTDREYFLLIVVHHFVFDAWAKSVFLHDVGAAYDACLGEREAKPAGVTQYRTLAYAHARQAREFAPSTFEYWERSLRDLPTQLAMPADKPRPAVFTHAGGVVPFALSEQVSRNLMRTSRSLGVTNYVLLLAALVQLLHEEAGDNDLFVRSYGSSRSTAGSDEAIGYYMQQIVVRVMNVGGRGWPDLIAEVHRSTLGALSNMNVPFAHLVRCAGPKPGAGYASRFQLVFNYIDFPRRWLALNGLEVQPVHIDEPLVAKYDLSLVAEAQHGIIRGRFMYYADLFGAERMRYLASRYCELLTSMAEGEMP
jgi:amino acid adenylation domain-containing protein